eukprot:TRINITY_DN2317_c0_g1_i1.p1 TRINITY_DN2317_c0_g1~~TRINITY_DN2317_c0_g1_i1.p1  ORF type:complete len:344 (-),score=46.29 TRINITY_DN2317_c0_g1_i1:837-1868(-)
MDDLFKSEWQQLQQEYSDQIFGEGPRSYLHLCEQYPRATAPVNNNKNRYKNILPQDDTRVKLIKGTTDYINANYIKWDVEIFNFDMFIATMAPLPYTFNDFWRIVWDIKISVVVMLMDLMEGGCKKGDIYLPGVGETLEGRDFYLTVDSWSVLTDQIKTRKIKIEHKRTHEIRYTNHIHYRGWSDHSIPISSESMIDIILAINTYYTTGYPLVHCSAGVGRTGTFISIVLALEKLRKIILNNSSQIPSLENILQEIDVPSIVRHLRNVRNPAMVQNYHQYKFIYQCIIDEYEFICSSDNVMEHLDRIVAVPENRLVSTSMCSSSVGSPQLLIKESLAGNNGIV